MGDGGMACEQRQGRAGQVNPMGDLLWSGSEPA